MVCCVLDSFGAANGRGLLFYFRTQYRYSAWFQLGFLGVGADVVLNVVELLGAADDVIERFLLPETTFATQQLIDPTSRIAHPALPYGSTVRRIVKLCDSMHVIGHHYQGDPCRT